MKKYMKVILFVVTGVAFMFSSAFAEVQTDTLQQLGGVEEGIISVPGPINTDEVNEDEINALIDQLVDDDINACLEAANKLISLDKPALFRLLGRLEGASVALKGQIVFLLGRISDPEAAPFLMEILRNDENGYIRRNAAEALGKIGDTQALDALTIALFDNYVGVRERAAGALGKLRDTRAVDSLLDRLIDDRNRRVRSAVVGALGQLKDRRATLVLIAELTSEDDLLYKNIVAASLGEIGDSNALPALMSHLSKLKEIKSGTTEPVIIFQLEEAIRIAEDAIAKIRSVSTATTTTTAPTAGAKVATVVGGSS